MSETDSNSGTASPREVGDAACWLASVCPECGLYVEDQRLGVCPHCGGVMPEDE